MIKEGLGKVPVERRWWFFPDNVGACSVSGATEEEGVSYYGKEKRLSEVLGERTKRGVWLVFPLDVKEMEYWLVRHLEEVCFVPGVGSSLKEGVFA